MKDADKFLRDELFPLFRTAGCVSSVKASAVVFVTWYFIIEGVMPCRPV